MGEHMGVRHRPGDGLGEATVGDGESAVGDGERGWRRPRGGVFLCFQFEPSLAQSLGKVIIHRSWFCWLPFLGLQCRPSAVSKGSCKVVVD